MNRKWMVTVWITALGLSLAMAGCPKKKPVPPPAPAPEPTPVAPPTEVKAPPPPPPVQEAPDPLDAELDELNRYLQEQGLLGDVFFDFDKYDLKPEARQRLDKNAQFMRDHPQFLFTIEGHCDERGTNEYNIALGDRRANAAKGYLGSQGGVGDVGTRVQTVSYGEERPFCTTAHDETCWWQNRRAHFVVTGRR